MQSTALPDPDLDPASPLLDLLGRPAVVAPRMRGRRRAVLAAAPHPLAPRRARALVAEACHHWQLREHRYPLALIADELVANAVVHARTSFELHLWDLHGLVQVAVHDRDPAFSPSWWDHPPPVGELADGAAPHGARYGLSMVRELAERCGGYRHPDGGKVMWAALATAPSRAGVTIDLRTRQARASAAPRLAGLPRPAAPPSGEPSCGEVSGTEVSGTEPLEPCTSRGVVRRTVLVNGVRRAGAVGRPGWRLELLLGWRAQAPDWVDLTLRATPLHPALPQGHWRMGREVLRRGLDRPSGDPQVRIHPDPTGHSVLLDLVGERSRVVHVPARQLHDFLAETDGQG